MAKVLFARVARRNIVPEGRHRAGLPPELHGGVDERRTLPHPRVVLIDHRADGVFLLRYAEDAIFAGDTWHPSVEEAKEQAMDEYGLALQDWQAVPDGESDPVRFALSLSP